MGDYLLLERIALGGMGEVWLAKRKGIDGSYGELRALKFLHAEHAGSPEVVAMFVEEARLASRLEHPSVARLYELGRDEDTYYIAMEHLFGRDLLALLRRARDREVTIPAPLVASIGQRVAEALDAARHATDDDGSPLEIVHRDVSPQNIVLGFDGRVKLIDFGIARAATAVGGEQRRGRLVRGKLGYVSPEQAQGKKVDHRSDQFSLGICLWEMLVLRPLFRRRSDSATLDDVIRARVPPVRSKVPGCPAELAAIVEKMLQKDPEARFHEAADVAAALSSFLGRLPQRPERQDLAALVRKLFDEDYTRDRMRLDALELVGREGRASVPSGGEVTPPRGLPAELVLSLAQSSLFDDDDDPHQQATAIFPDAGPLALRAEREVLFRRDSAAQAQRPSDPTGSSRGPVHATFRPGRAGAAEIWRPPATDLAESVAAFEDPALAEEREAASFDAEGAFHGRAPVSRPPAPEARSERPSSRPPPAMEELPTRSELDRLAGRDGVRLPPPAPLPSFGGREPTGPTRTAPAGDSTEPVRTVTQKIASIPPPPEPAPPRARALVLVTLALGTIVLAGYAAWMALGHE
jgi:eukaryotic-like serine/threonine-protein kinase